MHDIFYMNQWMDFFSEILDYSNCKTVSGGDLYTWDTSKLDLENLVTSSVSRSNKIDFYIFFNKTKNLDQQEQPMHKANFILCAWAIFILSMGSEVL